jgi:hypothetical protein
VTAHRYFYEQAYGPVPDGLVLDHLCRVRNCVRPDHMEAVSSTENRRRGTGVYLDAATVEVIRTSDETCAKLAADFGVSAAAVESARRADTWRDVGPPGRRTVLPIDYPPPNPTARCACGCGLPAPIARASVRKDGLVAGHPQRYIHGHSGGTPRKLTSEQVAQIRVSTEVLRVLAARYGVDSSTIADIRNGKTYRSGMGTT